MTLTEWTIKTARDVLDGQRRGWRGYTAVAGAAVIALCYIVEMFIAPVDWATAAIHSVVPQIADPDALLLAVGIIGATVMPHAIYLHSGLMQSRIPPRSESDRRRMLRISNREVV